MKCPFCGYTESKVIDSRPTDEGSRIRRRSFHNRNHSHNHNRSHNRKDI